ncbi:MAG: methyltransferase domain-containing protein [Anaerolineae bacterium]|nr:methyltransferase domain-containing protein [Anaerolineae bacterium]
MKTETLPLLCNPYAGEPFKLEDKNLVGIASGSKFPIRNGIPVILDKPSYTTRNRWSRGCYDLLSAAYDPVLALGDRINLAADQSVRREHIQNLRVSPGDMVLETAMGTGSNFLHLPEYGKYYGVDLSFQMLRRAQSKLAANGRQAELFNCDGAYLPFRDSIFDLVFQMGGLQFYGDPFRGVSEMARVAKPGARIVIIDEVSGARRMLKRMPAHARYAQDSSSAIKAMPRLVPHSMTQISSSPIANGQFYSLIFSKPG